MHTIETVRVNKEATVEEMLEGRRDGVPNIVTAFPANRSSEVYVLVEWEGADGAESGLETVGVDWYGEVLDSLSQRPAAALTDAGIVGVQDLPDDLDDLTEIEGVGAGTVETIRNELNR